MPINENLAKAIQQYKLERDLSISELAEDLGVGRTILEIYLNGTGNPRADTLDLLSERSGIPLAELVAGPPGVWEQASVSAHAARIFSSLPAERRERCVTLFLELVRLMTPPDDSET